jgi:phosphoribosylanthranilate isomerase
VIERRQPIIKICGIRDAASARVVIDAGARAMGFMLADSRRRVSLDEVVGILDQVDGSGVKSVGVVVNEAAGTLDTWRDIAGLDVIQLSGDEESTILDELEGDVWKAVRFEPGTHVDDAARAIDPWFDHSHPVDLMLVDAFVPGRYGGSGHRADWELVSRLADRYPIVLAGGLSPDNVSEAIEQSMPLGVDVSSGVETNQVKDPAKIEKFVTIARERLVAQRPD